ncbi:MAG: 4Fe-4S binding protein [Clostridium sp.]
MGADEGVILSDRGSLLVRMCWQPSYTLSQGIELLGGADLILCGRQTARMVILTPEIGLRAIAEHLHNLHCAWVSAAEEADAEQITLKQDFGSVTQVPGCVIHAWLTADKDICVPRLPSLASDQKRQKDRPVRVVTFGVDLPGPGSTRFGAVGSPTRVERIFAPEAGAASVVLEGTAAKKAEQLTKLLAGAKIHLSLTGRNKKSEEKHMKLLRFDPQLCTLCGACIDKCPFGVSPWKKQELP